MTRRSLRTCLIAAVSVVALLLVAAPAQAMIWCSHLFPFGLINGGQIARVDAEVTDTVDGSMPCPMDPMLMFPVEVSFHDRTGKMIGDPTMFTLEQGQGVIESADFKGDPSMPIGRRTENRATVMIMAPSEKHIHCLAEVRLSLQVFDRLTMRTQYILSEVVMLDLPAVMK